MERAILVRHGESTASAKGLLNGDPYHYFALTRAGQKQAKALGERLHDEAIDLCVTSRFPRTRETADRALEGRPIPRLVVADLDDVRVGEFEGRPVEDLRLWQRTHALTEPLPGGGESRVDSITRYCGAFQSLLASTEASLLTSGTTAAQAEESLDKLIAAGWPPEATPFQATHYTQATPAIAMTYSGQFYDVCRNNWSQEQGRDTYNEADVSEVPHDALQHLVEPPTGKP